MRKAIPARNTINARSMRKRPTEAERKLWSALRDRRLNGLKFRRQVPVGSYIADFLCVEHGLVVEVDGSQHFESTADSKRDKWLSEQGYRVLRLWNIDMLKDIEAVKATVASLCGVAV